MGGKAHILFLAVVSTVILLAAPQAKADRTISADTYYDKVHGMWLGQILGNYAGRPSEGVYTSRGGNPATDVDWGFVTSTTVWDGDDDTAFEYLYMKALPTTADPNMADIRQTWVDHIPWLFRNQKEAISST